MASWNISYNSCCGILLQQQLNQSQHLGTSNIPSHIITRDCYILNWLFTRHASDFIDNSLIKWPPLVNKICNVVKRQERRSHSCQLFSGRRVNHRHHARLSGYMYINRLESFQLSSYSIFRPYATVKYGAKPLWHSHCASFWQMCIAQQTKSFSIHVYSKFRFTRHSEFCNCLKFWIHHQNFTFHCSIIYIS